MPDRTVLRTVLPTADRSDLLPLYVVAGDDRRPAQPAVRGRTSLTVEPGGAVSLQSYFNAFPAAYWQRFTPVERIDLDVRTTGSGSITLCSSDADGRRSVLDRRSVDGRSAATGFEIPLEGFDHGGWCWFELAAGAGGLTLESAEWRTAEAAEPRSVSIVITTHNRPDYCVRLLAALGSDEQVAAAVDRIFLVDQGTDKATDAPGYPDVAATHGSRLVPIEQGNLGGSGGFSRGMVELLARNESDFLLLLDDDIAIEPEGVLRAVRFAANTTEPTIVGGHMFDLNAPLTLHAFGEVVDRRTFDWGPPDPDHSRHDFAAAGLAETPWLHRRADVDFNGWWMCLIPRPVLADIGLSMPYFIKWDDAEYGLRAAAHGYRTVSLPGAAVWHVSWLDKDDSRDWQSYFHSRNRMISALLHSPRRVGGRLLLASVGLDLKHLLFMHYYAVRLRHEALRDVLLGPGMLERTLGTRLPWARSIAAEFDEMTPVPHRGAPADPPADPPAEDPRVVAARPHGAGIAVWLLRNAARHLLPVRRGAHADPVALTRDEARWWRVPTFDAVLVPLADGSGSALYRRDPRRYRRGILRSAGLHARLLLSWRRLRREYREEAPDLTSPTSWERYLGLSAAGEDAATGGTEPATAASSREIRSS